MKELSDDHRPAAPLSSPSQGYQSRVFSFLQRQVYRLREGLGTGWRQVRFSVQMTGQLLFLPFQWLQGWPQRPPALTTPPPPTKLTAAESPAPLVPLERILAEITAAGYHPGLTTTNPDQPALPQENPPESLENLWSTIDEEDWNTTLLAPEQLFLVADSPRATKTKIAPRPQTPPPIRGLASRLWDRQLVLIGEDNRICSVLSPSQQHHILQRIAPDLVPQLPPAPTGLPAGDPLPPVLTEFLPPLLPPPPTNLWQQLGRWVDFYREYWRVTEVETPEDDEAAADAPGILASSAPPSIPTSVMAPAPMHQPIEPQTPPWLETPTRPLGYHRSWGTRLLEWLDRLTLAIENWILRGYAGLRRIFSP